MQVYAFQAKDTELIDWATEIRLRAERRLGQLMAEASRTGNAAKGTRGNIAGKVKGTTKGRGKAKAKFSGGGKMPRLK